MLTLMMLQTLCCVYIFKEAIKILTFNEWLTGGRNDISNDPMILIDIK